MNMTWQEKFRALNELTPTYLGINRFGDWHVAASSRSVKVGNFLESYGGKGSSPQEAVEDDWKKMAESQVLIVINAFSEHSEQFRWNGSRWERN
jgi:hypothetical protein